MQTLAVCCVVILALAATASAKDCNPSLIRHFTVRRDFRECAAPLCGGYFIQDANGGMTCQLDGTYTSMGSELYVAAINNPENFNLDATVSGHITFYTISGGSMLPQLTVVGGCPAVEGAGICVEECRGDEGCDGDSEQCCPNGCGHVCQERVESPCGPHCASCAYNEPAGGFSSPEYLQFTCLECDAGFVKGSDPEADTGDIPITSAQLELCFPKKSYICGGFAGLTCPDNQACIDDPSDNCDPNNGGADCLGLCVPRCGGIAGLGCPDLYACEDDPSDDCDPKNGGADCGGICVPPNQATEPEFCGGIAAIQCPGGKICIDDPNDGCDVNNGGRDCGGICVPQCGGFLGLTCPVGLDCVDYEEDSCDPKNGGADCIGICVDEAPAPKCDPNEVMTFSIRQDFRRCVSPLCGGAFIKSRAGVCRADGTRAAPGEEYYVAVIEGYVDYDSGVAIGYITEFDGGSFGLFGKLVIVRGCPEPEGFGTCVSECAASSECSEGKLCCSNGCGQVCTEPISDPCGPHCATCVRTPFNPENKFSCTVCEEGYVKGGDPDADTGSDVLLSNQLDRCFPRKPAGQACGGIAGLPCPPGEACVDDTSDDCTPPFGADCPGICVPTPVQQSCGGFAGFPCPAGQTCVDDPTDDCAPPLGADCPGICIDEKPPVGGECCDPALEPGVFGNPIPVDGYVCCPTNGEWVGSIGDGRTFPCPGAPNGPFGAACETKDLCCDPFQEPGKFGNPIAREGYACCPSTGEWVGSIGDGRTFPCPGGPTGPFGVACEIQDLCCDPKEEPGKFGNPIAFEGYACCPSTGQWVGSIGDGKTFPCPGAANGPFGEACEDDVPGGKGGCQSDNECKKKEFCDLCTGKCQRRKRLGQACGGFSPCPAQCKNSLSCFTAPNPLLADAPGKCCKKRKCSCKKNEGVSVLDATGCPTCRCTKKVRKVLKCIKRRKPNGNKCSCKMKGCRDCVIETLGDDTKRYKCTQCWKAFSLTEAQTCEKKKY